LVRQLLPAAAAAAVIWRSNVDPVDLTARLRSDILLPD